MAMFPPTPLPPCDLTAPLPGPKLMTGDGTPLPLGVLALTALPLGVLALTALPLGVLALTAVPLGVLAITDLPLGVLTLTELPRGVMAPAPGKTIFLTGEY